MTTGNEGGRKAALTRTADELRGEAVEIAHNMIAAYEKNEMGSFHLFLGMLVVTGQLLYEANAREEREVQTIGREAKWHWYQDCVDPRVSCSLCTTDPKLVGAIKEGEANARPLEEEETTDVWRKQP
jgi:hypothetical protein